MVRREGRSRKSDEVGHRKRQSVGTFPGGVASQFAEGRVMRSPSRSFRRGTGRRSAVSPRSYWPAAGSCWRGSTRRLHLRRPEEVTARSPPGSSLHALVPGMRRLRGPSEQVGRASRPQRVWAGPPLPTLQERGGIYAGRAGAIRRQQGHVGAERGRPGESNDPLITCDPLGFPRSVLYETRGFEFLHTPTKTVAAAAVPTRLAGDLD